MEPMQDATTIERMLLDQAKRTRTPANGSIELLPLCNMNCDMCYVRLSREEMERQGRLRTADEWLEIGRQMQEAGVLFLLLTGGEPFLFPEFRKLYLGLRKMEGVSCRRFREQFQTEMEDVYGKEIETLCREGLLVKEEDRVRLTKRGIDVSNLVMSEFLLDE